MSGLESYVNNTVSIITADGRNFVGTLKGFDQTVNIILDESHERVYSMTAGIEQVVLGLHIIRGDNVAIIGQLDESVDSKLDFSSIRGMPLEPNLQLTLGGLVQRNRLGLQALIDHVQHLAAEI
ncbi:conserved hypothetical protein [Culex quinquefasciatus]|uniref:U6 snRNA-associated Sm-like protein LSm8 n=1 Tax=Culex quinquefasciatus TaxID=7176 RepID=B0WHZ0_CULQU|nr:conserved hypothetical protein [Culex quinquefasciatus]|eukprot:XP_001848324.1 conserved hypothetical protein [Culex quinquefasciatus]